MSDVKFPPPQALLAPRLAFLSSHAYDSISYILNLCVISFLISVEIILRSKFRNVSIRIYLPSSEVIY